MQYFPEFAVLVADYLSQKDRTPTWLAHRLQINPGTVNRWLNHNTRPRNPEMVVRIADVLGVYSAKERQTLFIAAGYGYGEEIGDACAIPSREQPLTPPLAPHQENLTVPAFISENSPGPNPNAQADLRRAPFMAPTLPLSTVIGSDHTIVQLTKLFVFEQPNATNIQPVALLGMAGIGKTALALAFAHSTMVREQFPDGVLWAALGPNPALRDLLNDWGHALGIDLSHERSEKACHERLRNFLHHQRVFLIIDDVWEIRHCELFQVVGPYGRILLTTRESPIAFKFATRERTLRLDILAPSAAMHLLRHLALEIVAVDEAEARQLCERLEYLPLALVLAGRLLATEADIPSRMRRILRDLIEQRQSRLQLLQLEERLGLADDQPASLQKIFGMSVQRLNLVDQARLAELSTIARLPFTWDIESVMQLWSCTADEAETTISNFIQRGLAARRGEGYWMHALLVDHAAELLVQRNGIPRSIPICA